MKYSIFFLAIGFTVFGACKKSNDGPSTTEILTSTKWQLRQLLLESPLGSLPADITLGTFKPCELDDVVEFKTGGVYSCSEYKDICAPGTNYGLLYNLSGGNWSLSNGDSLLTIVKGFNQYTARFGSKTSSQIQLYQDQKNYLDEQVRYTYILKAVQ